MVPSAAACLTGSGAILAATGYRLTTSFPGMAACICLASGFAILVTWTLFTLHADTYKEHAISRVAFSWLLVVSLSLLMGARAAETIPHHYPRGQEQEFSATVYRVEQQRYDQRAYLHCNDHSNNAFNAIARLPLDTRVHRGDIMHFTARPYVYDQDSPSPARLYFLYRGISASFYLDGAEIQVDAAGEDGFKSTFRDKVGGFIRSTYSPVTASILMALYFGNRDYIDKETLHLFTYAGALHVLAASGLHVGIIACIPLFLGWLLQLGRKTTWILCLLTVFTYLYCTDMPVSLIRAAIMLGIAVLHVLGNQQKNTFNILFITASVILMIFPYEVFNPGFQLSFAATFGILLLFPVISSRLPALPLGIHRAMSVTIAAQVFVIPIIALHMKELNVASFISNITIVPGVSLVLVTSLVQPLFAPVPHIAGFSATAIDLMVSLIIKCARVLSEMGGHGTIANNMAALVTGYLALFIPFVPGLKKKKRMIALLVITLLIPVLLLRHQQQAGQIQAWKLGGTHGNGAVVISGKGTAVVYGLPGEYEGLEKLNSYLRGRSISAVYLYIPRPGYAQLKQAVYAVKKLPVSRLVLHRNFRFSFYFEKLCRVAETDGCQLQILNYHRSIEETGLTEKHGKITMDDLSTPNHRKIIPVCSALHEIESSGLIIL